MPEPSSEHRDVRSCGDDCLACEAAVTGGATLGTKQRNEPQSDLVERRLHRRAVEAVIWGMPAVNLDPMYQAMVRETRGVFNQIVYWSRLPDWKNQTLTPNPDSVYLMPFIDTKDTGPMVLEIPPADDGSITGTVMDCWQSAIEDVGPAGVDKGQGAKYLILPPGDSEEPPDGYIRCHLTPTPASPCCGPSLGVAATPTWPSGRLRAKGQAVPAVAGRRPA